MSSLVTVRENFYAMKTSPADRSDAKAKWLSVSRGAAEFPLVITGTRAPCRVRVQRITPIEIREYPAMRVSTDAHGETFEELLPGRWRKTWNELFSGPRADGYSRRGEVAEKREREQLHTEVPDEIISLIKVSQGVSGIGANVRPDITFLKVYMKRYLFRETIEEGYGVLRSVRRA